MANFEKGKYIIEFNSDELYDIGIRISEGLESAIASFLNHTITHHDNDGSEFMKDNRDVLKFMKMCFQLTGKGMEYTGKVSKFRFMFRTKMKGMKKEKK